VGFLGTGIGEGEENAGSLGKWLNSMAAGQGWGERALEIAGSGSFETGSRNPKPERNPNPDNRRPGFGATVAVFRNHPSWI
jgi:hypothetical protein